MLQAFVVSFADVLMILMATCINSRLNQFNDLLERMMHEKGFNKNDTMWRKLRHHYVRLIDLIRFADSHMHILAFVAIGHNSLQFAFQVFTAFKPNFFNILSYVHFYSVLIVVGVQLFATLFTCANMNRKALKTLELLRNVPAKFWSTDVSDLS
jgi:hypothetical protein